MMNQVGQQYSTYGNPLRNLVKRPHKSDKSTPRPADLTNVLSIHSVSSGDCSFDSFDSLAHSRIKIPRSQTRRPSVHTHGPEVDPKVLIDTLTFYPGYRGYVAGIVKSKKAAGGYFVKMQRRTAILVSADEYGVVILSNDDASLQCRINWPELADIDHVHTDGTSTPLRKRKRNNYIALRLKDGSVYVINSLQTPELHMLIMDTYSNKVIM
ncbi:hypothetical protein SARC_06252 [Sphaeroforma arctica JP610]|uniref:Uncharacterized protein n=1 Tax=Sphaeroforma arctica JP610 TaxID=667725 RepID=A0A0L0FXZ8_9EUKA|nr:hypothetical protein SARC_06252 [Sphaeroforma arctica JP610]KNC81436.1 hypothetical protein SARC_06252 [Sphaeroforma arctica JP610]|eukprot:XP_014155338.1 hypothetical protein SARC_06252 [Sphaeroforma arctica JP610]